MKKSSQKSNKIATLEGESELLRSTITNLMGQLDSAQKRMQQVFFQSRNVVNQLAEREVQMSKRSKHQNRRVKEILENNNHQKKTSKNENNDNDDDDDDDQNISSSRYALARKKIASATRIRLNVGGRIFETTRKVLTKHAGSVFDLLLSGDYPIETDEKDGAIFLDRDPDVFAHILRYLRTDTIPAGFLGEQDTSRALMDGEDDDDVKKVEEFLNFIEQKEKSESNNANTFNNNNEKNKALLLLKKQYYEQLRQHFNETGAGMKFETSTEEFTDSPQQSQATTLNIINNNNNFEGGARAAAQVNNNNNNNNENNIQSQSQPLVSQSQQQQQLPTISTTTTNWSEYSLAQRHHLLEMEARYFMLDDLLLKLSKNRMRWFCCAQRSRPSARCFATMQVVGTYGYVFGGCSATDAFFSDLYRVCLHPNNNNNSNNNNENNVHNNNSNDPSRYYYDDPEDDEDDEDEEEENENDDDDDMIIKNLVSRNNNSNNASTSKKNKKKIQKNSASKGGVLSATENKNNHNSASIDTASLAYYRGPFDWERVTTKKGQVPEPRSGHTMNVVPAVTNFHSSLQNLNNTNNSNNNNNQVETSSPYRVTQVSSGGGGRSEANDHNIDDKYDDESEQEIKNNTNKDSTTNDHHRSHHVEDSDKFDEDEDYHEQGGLLVLFGNDRSKMLANVIVFDIAESAWRKVRQVESGDDASIARNRNNSSSSSSDTNQAGIPLPRSGHSFTLISSITTTTSSIGKSSREGVEDDDNHKNSNHPTDSSSPVTSSKKPFQSSSSSNNTKKKKHQQRTFEKQRFVLIGGKQIFPETTHYDDVYFAEYDPFNLTLSWTKAHVINNNSAASAGAAGITIPQSALALSPSDTVEPRSYHSTVYREQDDLVYVFGGIINNVYSNELCTFCPTTGVWRTVTNSASSPDLASHHQNANFGLWILPSYVPPAARSGHVAFVVDDGERMLAAGSYSEDTEELTVAMLTFSTMKWTTAKVDPRFGGHLETPSRRAAISGCFLPPLSGGAGSRLPMLVVFGGFELSGRRCFNDLYVLPL